MAYDPKDPADVKIVTDAVNAALEEAREQHEEDIQGLKDKNRELVGKLNKARAGENNADEVVRLEGELADIAGKLSKAEKDLRQANRDLAAAKTAADTANAELASERETANNLVVDNDLTAALSGANVKPELLDGAKSLLRNGAVVKEVDGKRQAFVGDKPLSEHVKDWSLGDQGKHYVAAPNNGGGGAGNPGNPSGGDKKIWQMNDAERIALHNANPADFQRRMAAGENVKPPEAKS